MSGVKTDVLQEIANVQGGMATDEDEVLEGTVKDVHLNGSCNCP